MKKCLFMIAVFFICSSIFAQENSVLVWAKPAIVIDGDAHDWNLPLKHYDSNTKLFFDFENDSVNLYLCFQSNDEMNQLKMIKAGMKIILTSKINGKHKASLDYPLPAADTRGDQAGNAMASDPVYSHQKMFTDFISGDTLMEVKGFTGKEGIIPSNDASGLHAAIGIDKNNVFTYELSIPLKELCGNDFDVKDLSKGIALSVIIDAMKKPAHSGNGNEGNGFSGEGRGGGGRMGGGGRSGGMGHSGGREGQENSQFQSERSSMFEKSELKERLTLSTHP